MCAHHGTSLNFGHQDFCPHVGCVIIIDGLDTWPEWMRQEEHSNLQETFACSGNRKGSAHCERCQFTIEITDGKFALEMDLVRYGKSEFHCIGPRKTITGGFVHKLEMCWKDGLQLFVTAHSLPVFAFRQSMKFVDLIHAVLRHGTVKKFD